VKAGRGTELVTRDYVHDPLRLWDRGDKRIMQARLQVAMDGAYSSSISENQRRQTAARRAQGHMTGGPRPFGWKRVEYVVPLTGETRTCWRENQLDPVECDYIRRAVEDVINGVSLEEIARRWNADPISKRPVGKGWRGSTVHKVLVAPRIAGLVQVPKPREGIRYPEFGMDDDGKPVVGKWPAIVDLATWERCRATLRTRGFSGRQAPRRYVLLTSMVVCECGVTMRRNRRLLVSGVYHDTWRCRAEPPVTPGCGNWIDGGDGDELPDLDSPVEPRNVEELVLGLVLRRFDTGELPALIQARQSGGDVDAVQRELAELRAHRLEYEEQARHDRRPPAETNRYLAGLDADERALTDRLGNLTRLGLATEFAGTPGALRAAWPELTLSQRRALVAAALEDDGKVHIARGRRWRQTFDPRRVA
jgi:hypothetical protein